MKELLELYTIFFKIGGFTFGGGYAMLPILQEELVKKRKWATDEELLDYYAIGQVTPGIIAVNTATFIGQKQKGIIGAIVATLGLVTPSLIFISIISRFMKEFQQNQIFQHAFSGIQVVVVALILSVAIDMSKQTIKDKIGLILAIFSFAAIAIFKLSPIIVVIVSSIVGLFAYKDIDFSKENK
ncbi:MAG TPA: chromate transporter [Tissierellaceae bacterium]